MSVRSNYNIEKPFLWILRQLCGQDIHLVQEIAIAPPDEVISAEQFKLWEQQLAESSAFELPEDDDDL